MARFLLNTNRADRVLFLPAYRQPHKDQKQTVTAYEHRRAMLALALEDGMALSDMERDRGGLSYTFDTLTALTEQGAPGDSYAWIIGGDSLRNLHTWHRAGELAERFAFLTYPRGGETLPTAAELSAHWGSPIVEKLLKHVIPDAEEFTENSTEIRALIRRNGAESVIGRITPAVAEYIKQNQLYTGEDRMEEAVEKQTKKCTAQEVADFCERVLYAHKAENIIRFDPSGFDWAQSDHYIVCTGTSAPHIGALAERLQRELRTRLGVRPSAVDGTPQSQWIVADFASVIVHIMTQEARDRYQLEELWSDVPREDAVKRLDEEYRKRTAEKDA